MTDNEIIKALECCSKITFNCDGCPLKHLKYSECYELVIRSTLDLINRQKANYEALKAHEEKEHQYCKNVCEPKYKAEIERLEQNLKEAHIDTKEHQAHIRNLKKVIDKIEDHINPLPFETDYDKAIRIAKAEAVKEFAERFENELTQIEEIYIDEEHENFISANKVIALLVNLVKEMVGES